MKDARSRGELPVNFLKGTQTPEAYLSCLKLEVKSRQGARFFCCAEG